MSDFMQKRHYEYIAEILKNIPDSTVKNDFICAFAKKLSLTNDRFNPVMFRDECLEVIEA